MRLVKKKLFESISVSDAEVLKSIVFIDVVESARR